jgi:MFS family permease
MAILGISWGIAFAAGPFLAGLILDNLNPNWLWYASGIVGLTAVGVYFSLHRGIRKVETTIPVVEGD